MGKRKGKETGTAGKMHYLRYPASSSERDGSITASFSAFIGERKNFNIFSYPAEPCWLLMGPREGSRGRHLAGGGRSVEPRVVGGREFGSSEGPAQYLSTLPWTRKSKRRQGWLGGLEIIEYFILAWNVCWRHACGAMCWMSRACFRQHGWRGAAADAIGRPGRL